MTIQEALNNVNLVVMNARLTRQEHAVLVESLQLLENKCKETDAKPKDEPEDKVKDFNYGKS